MQERMRTIRLYGVLGATFGRVHRLAVSSPQEAVRALSVLLPGFEQFLNTSRLRGLVYSVFCGKRNISERELDSDKGETDIRIAPVIIGSKRAGIFQVILGAVLIASAMFWPGMSIPVSNMIGNIGIAMALGGVIQMLSPQTKGVASKQDADNQASYAFGSVTNTAAQGYPVAWAYGKPRIGGAIISAGIYVEDQQ